jgi:hypothetical protein
VHPDWNNRERLHDPCHAASELASTDNLLPKFGMSFTGKVCNGVIVLPPGVSLPEGAEVEVTAAETAGSDSFLAFVEKVSKRRAHWPKDYSHNHGHYIGGEPKKS